MHGESLLNKISYLQVDRDMSFDAIRMLDAQGKFQIQTTPLSTDSSRNHQLWFKLEVRRGDTAGAWVLDTGFFALRKFVVYGPFSQKASGNIPTLSSGTGFPSNEYTQINDHFSFFFRPDKPDTYTIYIHTSSDFALNYNIRIWDSISFAKKEMQVHFLSGLCYGLLFAIFLCNVVMSVAFKERLYAYNSLSTLFALLTLATFSGHLQQYVPLLEHPVLYPLVQIFPTLWLMFGSKFGRHFLDLKVYMPRLNSLLYYLENVGLITLGLLLFQVFSVGLMFKSLGAVIGTISLATAAFLTYRKGFLPAKWYLAGLGTLFLAVIGIAASNYNLIEFTSQNIVLQIGIVLDGFFFLIALGSRIRRIRNLSGLFEDENASAARPEHIDAQTGAKNQSGWRKFAPKILVQGARCAVLKIGLDNVHNADATRTVAKAISRETGAQDLYARYGENAFFVLFSSVPNDDVLCIRTELLLEDILRKMDADRNGFAARICIGISRFPQDGKDLPSLMSAADETMQAVKKGGISGYGLHSDLK